MDPSRIEALITERTSAIIPVHVYGNICDVDAIEAIARKHGLKVFYDAAHAFGERYDGKSVGSFGDASMFSFHATKVFHSIEGRGSLLSRPCPGQGTVQAEKLRHSVRGSGGRRRGQRENE